MRLRIRGLTDRPLHLRRGYRIILLLLVMPKYNTGILVLVNVKLDDLDEFFPEPWSQYVLPPRQSSAVILRCPLRVDKSNEDVQCLLADRDYGIAFFSTIGDTTLREAAGIYSGSSSSYVWVPGVKLPSQLLKGGLYSWPYCQYLDSKLLQRILQAVSLLDHYLMKEKFRRRNAVAFQRVVQALISQAVPSVSIYTTIASADTAVPSQVVPRPSSAPGKRGCKRSHASSAV